MTEQLAFRGLVARCGLSPLFASSVLEHAFARAGVRPDELTLEMLASRLVVIERAITPFLGEREVACVVATLRAWSGRDLHDPRGSWPQPATAHGPTALDPPEQPPLAELHRGDVGGRDADDRAPRRAGDRDEAERRSQR